MEINITINGVGVALTMPDLDNNGSKYGLLGAPQSDTQNRQLMGQQGIVPGMAQQVLCGDGSLNVQFLTDLALGGTFNLNCTLEVYLDGVYTGYGARAELSNGSPLVYFPFAINATIPNVLAGTHLVEIRYSKPDGSAWTNNGGRTTQMAVYGNKA